MKNSRLWTAQINLVQIMSKHPQAYPCHFHKDEVNYKLFTPSSQANRGRLFHILKIDFGGSITFAIYQ